MGKPAKSFPTSRFILLVLVLGLVSITPAFADSFEQGLDNYYREAYKQARNNFKLAVRNNPENPKYHFFLGNVYNRLEKYEQAELAYKKALALDTSYTSARRRLAFLFFNNEKWKPAAKQFKQLLTNHPRNYEYRFHHGVTLFQREKYEAARSELLTAREIRPEAPDPHYYLGRISLLREQNLNSISRFGRAIELEPSEGKYHFYRGLAYFRNDDYRTAGGGSWNSARDFKKAIEQEYNVPRARFMLGNSLLSRGLYLLRREKTENGIRLLRRSVKQYRQVLVGSNSASNAYHNMGIAYLGIGKLDLARQSVRKAIDLEPSVAFFYDSLGLIYFRRGDFEEALSSWTFVQEIESDYSSHPFGDLLDLDPLDSRLREARIRN